MTLGTMLGGLMPMLMAPEGDGGAGGGSGGDGSGGGDGGSGGGSGDGAGGSGSGSQGSSFGSGGDGDGDGAGGGNLPTVPEWAGTIEDSDVANWLAKKSERFPDMQTALRSHMELEAFRGVDETQLIKLVDPTETEAWHGEGGIFERLGRPKNADGYELPKPEEGQDMTGRIDLAEIARPIFFKHGVSKGAGEAIANEVNNALQAAEQAEDTEFYNTQAKEQALVSKEWGENINAEPELRGPKMTQAIAGAKALGFDPNTDEGSKMLLELERTIGTRVILNKMQEIGARLGEAGGGSHGGGGDSTFMTEDQALSEIKRREEDEAWMASYLDGDEAKNAEMKRLYEFAYPDR